MSTQNCKRRKHTVNRQVVQEGVVDLVSSSDTSPELADTSRARVNTTFPYSQESENGEEPDCALIECVSVNRNDSAGSQRTTAGEQSHSRRRTGCPHITQPTVSSSSLTTTTTTRGHYVASRSAAEFSGESDGPGHLFQDETFDSHFDSLDFLTVGRRRRRIPSGSPREPSRRLQVADSGNFPNSNFGAIDTSAENADSRATPRFCTRSGRGYSRRANSNPRMNIQRRIYAVERSENIESSNFGHRAISSLRRQTSSLFGQSLNAWIDYIRQVNPWLLLSFYEGDFTSDDYQMLLQLDEVVENKRGASGAVIEALPCFQVSQGEKGELCCICLSEFELDECLKKLPCSHFFHKACIERWLVENACCPIDKARVDG
eukprot:jgi/Galph1/5548/GphlegSOOS_G4195.1